MTSEDPILIAGGGIGGLSAALSFAQSGHRSVVLEKTQEFSEVGAGIQLGPNATRILNELGLGDALAAYGCQPEGIMIFEGANGKRLNTIPLKDVAKNMFGAPYYTIHRADLQTILLQALKSHQEADIVCGFEVATFDIKHNTARDTHHITVSSAINQTREGCMLIGADGIWSKIRNQLTSERQPKFTGKTAWRALLPISKIPEQYYADYIGLWFGKGAHLVHYPIKSGHMLNIVAVIDEDWAQTGWDTLGNRDQLETCFKHWTDDIQPLLANVPTWRKWSLFEMPVPKIWGKGPVTLLGDAVHPMLPFLAQGGAMAVEDAATLNHCLKDASMTLEHALRHYEKQRFERTYRVQKTARRLGKIYHYQGVMAFARNFAITNRSPLSLLRDYTWLYGHMSPL